MAGLSGYVQAPLETDEADAVTAQINKALDRSLSSRAGPNLTLLACRDTIGAGILENTPENLETWLKHTDEVKEGVYMPNYYKQGLSDEQ